MPDLNMQATGKIEACNHSHGTVVVAEPCILA